MENPRISSPVAVDTEYVEQICYEFSKLLYDVSEENERRYRLLEERYAALEVQCRKYEAQILQSENAGYAAKALIVIKQKTHVLVRKVKALCLKITKRVFMAGRALTTQLGIKDRLKKSALFRKLYMRGTIDKLRE